PRWLSAPLSVVMCGTVAFRRRRPLLAGSVALLCNVTLILVAGSPGTAVAPAIAWFCGLYAIAVWTDTRGFLIGIGVLVGGNAATLLADSTALHDTVP